MKFGKQMETEACGLPENWRPHLIHYKTLKKSIRSVVDELESRGLSTEWINTLYTEHESMHLDYIFDGDVEDPHPYIKITIDDPTSITTAEESDPLMKLIPVTQTPNTEPLSIKIELVKDSEFFHLLLHELAHAAALHDKEKERFIDDVDTLEGQLAVAASPQKKDLYAWREIFHLYMKTAIFTNEEGQYTARSYQRSQQQLESFIQELSRMNLTKKLSSKHSKSALAQFLAINAQLVHFKLFQSLNQTAMIKILKKHDKRTSLSATSEFPTFAKNNAIFVESILMSLYKAVQTKLVTIVPQSDDYDCPVCYSIAWRPIRLICGHVFCVRCLIKAHKKRLYDCPICRQEYAIGNADAKNLDQNLQDFMLLYFPKEIKEKRKENELEQATLMKEQQSLRHNLQNRTLAPAVRRSLVTSSYSQQHHPCNSKCNIM